MTGAGGGIGSAIVATFLKEGATVVASDLAIPPDATNGDALRWEQHDVASEESWRRVIDLASKDLGRLDILINNAGIARTTNVEETSLEDWRETLRVNLDGVFLGVKHGIAAMKDTGGGAIVNVASVAGLIGASMLPAYCASKGGVIAFTRSAALHCLERDYGIRVNAICPSYAETPMFDEIAASRSNEAKFRLSLERSLPSHRLATSQEVADGVLYLASDDSSYVNGSSLVVDGGLTAA